MNRDRPKTASERYRALHRALLTLAFEAKALSAAGHEDRARAMRNASQIIAAAASPEGKAP
jgi:hypothetical protein